MKNEFSPRRADGSLIYAKRDFFRAEAAALIGSIALYLVLFPLLNANGLLTSGLMSASFLLCVSFMHFVVGVVITNRAVKRMVEIISQLHGGLTAKAKLHMRREAALVKGYSTTAGLLKCVKEDGLDLPGNETYEALLAEAALFERLNEWLGEGKSARNFPCTDEEKLLIADCPLLSNKPVIYVANLSEADFAGDLNENPLYRQVLEIAEAEGSRVVPICGKIEEELSQMEPEDRQMFLEELGLHQSGLDRLVTAGYDLLGLISFLTAGKPEVRAWTITKGTKAPQAAGKIHSDFERGFIRAEVVPYETLIACGSLQAAKEKGLIRSEGKEYVMQDGDVVLFRFNV